MTPVDADHSERDPVDGEHVFHIQVVERRLHFGAEETVLVLLGRGDRGSAASMRHDAVQCERFMVRMVAA